MPALNYPVGLVVADNYKHAILKRWLSRVALCGAGRIVVVRPGLFDPYVVGACPDCRAAATAQRSGSQ